MSITVPTSYTKLRVQDFQTFEPIHALSNRAGGYEDLIEGQNHLYSQVGDLIGGIHFPTPWETSSTTFVTASDSASEDLHNVQVSGRLTKKLNDVLSSNWVYSFRVKVFGTDAEVRVTIRRHDDGGAVGLGSVTIAASGGWVSSGQVLTEAQVSVGGVAGAGEQLLSWSFEGRTTDVTGFVEHVHVREYVANSADMPANLP